MRTCPRRCSGLGRWPRLSSRRRRDGLSGSRSPTPTYSTVVGRPGLHLEDLYISGEHRGSGVGLGLLKHLARLAQERGCARLEWWVLRTNVSALRFYGRLRARGLDEIEDAPRRRRCDRPRRAARCDGAGR